jgi:hypothetical protein
VTSATVFWSSLLMAPEGTAARTLAVEQAA